MRNKSPTAMEDNNKPGKMKGGGTEEGLEEEDKKLIIDEETLLLKNQRRLRQRESSKVLKMKSSRGADDTSNLYPCSECGKVFKRKVKLQTHLQSHKVKEEECDRCKRTLGKSESISSHVCVGMDNNYKCSGCDESFKLKKDLVAHRETHKAENKPNDKPPEIDPVDNLDFSAFVASFVKWPVSCVKCKSELANIESYNAHMATHKELEPCVCLVCKMRFSCRDDFFLHKEVCHIEGMFECPHCWQRFDARLKYNRHLHHYTDKDNWCFVCETSFMNKDRFMAHMLCHKGVAFVCEKCKKIFKCGGHLRNHACESVNHDRGKEEAQCTESVWANEESEAEDVDVKLTKESCVCRLCGHTFDHRDELKAHLHTCRSQSQKYFKTKADLNMHTLLLGDEAKPQSFPARKATPHGHKELDSHSNDHLTSDYTPAEDLHWEDNDESLQNIISGLNSGEPLSSPERPIGAKISKVMIAGSNTLVCSTCGKFIYLRHSISELLDSSKLPKDTDEEYVFISRFDYSYDAMNYKDNTYCVCQNGTEILSSLADIKPAKHFTEQGCQDNQKVPKANMVKPTRSQSPKMQETAAANHKSKSCSIPTDSLTDTTLTDADNKSDKPGNKDCSGKHSANTLSSKSDAIQEENDKSSGENIDSNSQSKAKATKTTSEIGINCDLANDPDVNKNRDSSTGAENSSDDKLKNSEAANSKRETHKASDKECITNTETLTTKPESSVSASISRSDADKDAPNSTEATANTDNTPTNASNADGKREIMIPQNPGVNTVTDNRTVSLPLKLVNPVPGTTVTSPMPLKLLLPAGIFTKPITLRSVSQILNRRDVKMSVSSLFDSVQNKGQSSAAGCDNPTPTNEYAKGMSHSGMPQQVNNTVSSGNLTVTADCAKNKLQTSVVNSGNVSANADFSKNKSRYSTVTHDNILAKTDHAKSKLQTNTFSRDNTSVTTIKTNPQVNTVIHDTTPLTSSTKAKLQTTTSSHENTAQASADKPSTTNNNLNTLPSEIISQQLKEKKVYLSHLLAQKMGITITPEQVSDLISATNRNISFETFMSRGEKRKEPQPQKPRRGRPPKIPKIVKEIRRNKRDIRAPQSWTQSVLNKTVPSVSVTANSSSSSGGKEGEGSSVGGDVRIKLEPQNSDSNDENEEESSGTKTEFLASDVFIKEEEWDIVDF